MVSRMSLLPLAFSDWWDSLDRPHRLLDQDFGIGLHPEQLTIAAHIPQYSSRNRNPLLYYRPWAELLRRGDAGSSTVTADKNKFQVTLDVQQFKPEEINVKVIDKYVVVEAKHEEKQDEHGFISRQFVRKYLIPEQCDIEQVSSSLSSDGVLTISAPRKDVPMIENERQIRIEHTGKPAIRQSNEKGTSEEKKAVEKMDDK